MRKALCFLLFVLVISSLAAQKSNLGIFTGVGYYIGDVNPSKIFYSPKPAIGGFFRYDVNERYSARFSVINGTLSGSDSDFKNKYQQARNQSFSVAVTDFTTQLEFNFFPFSLENDNFPATPYITAGLTAFIGPKNSKSPVQMAIPFGFGGKFRANERFQFGVEWSMRKTFTDNIDELAPTFTNQYDEKQSAFSQTNDWYSFVGVFASFKFHQRKVKCDAYSGSFNVK